MGYRSNSRRNVGIIDSPQFFFVILCRSCGNIQNSNLSNGRLVPCISWEGQKALNALCYLAIHAGL